MGAGRTWVESEKGGEGLEMARRVSSSGAGFDKAEEGDVSPLFFDDEFEAVFLEKRVVFRIRGNHHA